MPRGGRPRRDDDDHGGAATTASDRERAASAALETAAVDLAEAGYHVFRLRPQSKEPFTGSRGLLDATRNEREILGWWDRMPDANIGINCGLSDVSVLDIDSKAGADPSRVIAELELEHHPCTRTGVAPERSEKYPDSLVGVRGAQVFVRGTMPTTNDLTVAGCEIESIGGYVVSPPSLHPCGIAYAGTLPPVLELPDDVARLRALVRTAVTGDVPSAGELPPAIGANRNVTLTSAAGTMRRRGMSEAEILAALTVMNADRCRPPLEEQEVRKIARSVGRYEPAEPARASAGRVIFASQVKAQPVEWLVPGRIPLGGVSLLAGDPKLGKSTLSCSYAAALSRDGHVTLFASAEDSFTRVIKPRLVAAGADLDRCAKFEMVDADGARNLDLPDDVGALAEQVAATGAALIVVDPLNAHLAGAIDSWKDHGIRRALAPLARVADEQGCAVLVVAHLNKTKGGEPLYRIGGSIGNVGAARSVLGFGRNPDDPNGDTGDERLVAHVASNWSALAPTQVYAISTATVVVDDAIIDTSALRYLRESQQTAAEAFGTRAPEERGDDTQEAIAEPLRDLQPHASRAVKSAVMAELDVSERTVKRAAQQMADRGELDMVRHGQPPSTVWRLVLPVGPAPVGPNPITVGGPTGETRILVPNSEPPSPSWAIECNGDPTGPTGPTAPPILGSARPRGGDRQGHRRTPARTGALAAVHVRRRRATGAPGRCERCYGRLEGGAS
jgi:hypothetical protein